MTYLLLAIVAGGFLLTRDALLRYVESMADKKTVPVERKLMVRQITAVLHSLVFILLASVALGIDYSQFILFASSAFAVLGVALFAQWSILSNLTASIIIFFKFPYRIGDHIRIVNKDADLSGMIEEIGSFHIHIRQAGGDLVTFPNTMLLQVAVIKLNANTMAETSQQSDKKPQQIESD